MVGSGGGVVGGEGGGSYLAVFSDYRNEWSTFTASLLFSKKLSTLTLSRKQLY